MQLPGACWLVPRLQAPDAACIQLMISFQITVFCAVFHAAVSTALRLNPSPNPSPPQVRPLVPRGFTCVRSGGLRVRLHYCVISRFQVRNLHSSSGGSLWHSKFASSLGMPQGRHLHCDIIWVLCMGSTSKKNESQFTVNHRQHVRSVQPGPVARSSPSGTGRLRSHAA